MATSFPPEKTAYLTLDLQNGIISRAKLPEDYLEKAAKATEHARSRGYKIIHVALGFLKGHPEISTNNQRLAFIKGTDMFVQGTPSTEVHPDIYKKDELIVYKHRISAFQQNSLDMILRSAGIENLILSGLSTSGVVLSTVRFASDLDYRLLVLKDACHDNDLEVHQVLTEKVFPTQATVLTVEQFISQVY